MRQWISIFSFKAALLVFAALPVLALMDLGALLQSINAKTSTSQTKLTKATVLHLVVRSLT